MALGVSMRRVCPDQKKTEAARKKYVSDAMAVPKVASAKKAAFKPSRVVKSSGGYGAPYNPLSRGGSR